MAEQKWRPEKSEMTPVQCRITKILINRNFSFVLFFVVIMSLSSSSLTIKSTFSLLSGYSIPYLGLGTWRSWPGQVQAAVAHALTTGYRHIDGAWTYENEGEVGEGILIAINKSKESLDSIESTGSSTTSPLTLTPLKREDIFITGKIWANQMTADLVPLCVQDSLNKLKTSYMDLLLIHWPIAFAYIPGNKFAQTEDKKGRFYVEGWTLQQTWTSMEKLVDIGLVRSIGCSNHSIEDIESILTYAKHKPVTNQVECHPYLNQMEMNQYLNSKNMVLTAYSPLGNVARDESEKSNSPLNDEVINHIAQTKKKSVAQIILRWHLQHNHVIIPKSVTNSRIEENSQLYDFELSVDEMAKIDELGVSKRKRFINPPFKPNNELWFKE